ncbi:TAXI family TRAP transporter solute-binding subunit [Acuticoccus sp. M5D2P5]|uniref:TAXI family TRAP transporter solute-binding subunit n=1 Tax=Acuticoccus kalidii TaxID=2910977 RepID=UPI001F379792|nr:TAXI family TRAP transporter solute-binding subunit [Acuticoccus kalidii]MCF3934706.1 TAXI family TRAP transporter solute-binding subunit [Acuticoccus kalidii]
MTTSRTIGTLARAAAIAAAVTISAAPASAQERMSIAGGSTGGVFFPLATGMAELLSNTLDGYAFSASATGGSGENVRLLGTDAAQFGLIMADAAYNGHGGHGAFEAEGGYEDVVGVMMTYQQVMHVVVPADSDIETMADLAGHRVSPGPAGSGTALMAAAILDAYGLTGALTLDPLSHSQQMTALGDGQLDAAFLLLPAGASAVTSHAAAHDIRFLPMDEEDALATLSEAYPFYFATNIPATSYAGQDADVPTVGVAVVLAASAQVPDDLVYAVTKQFNEHPEDLVPYHSIAKQIGSQTAMDGMPIPLHQGAQRYYEEIEHPGLSK